MLFINSKGLEKDALSFQGIQKNIHVIVLWNEFEVFLFFLHSSS